MRMSLVIPISGEAQEFGPSEVNKPIWCRLMGQDRVTRQILYLWVSHIKINLPHTNLQSSWRDPWVPPVFSWCWHTQQRAASIWFSRPAQPSPARRLSSRKCGRRHRNLWSDSSLPTGRTQRWRSRRPPDCYLICFCECPHSSSRWQAAVGPPPSWPSWRGRPRYFDCHPGTSWGGPTSHPWRATLAIPIERRARSEWGRVSPLVGIFRFGRASGRTVYRGNRLPHTTVLLQASWWV